MTHTAAYSHFHRALLEGSREFGVELIVARAAVALYERGGRSRSDVLQVDLREVSGAATRRALGRMYKLGLAVGNAVDGGPRRPGMRTRVALTQSGRSLAGRVLTLAELRGAKAA